MKNNKQTEIATKCINSVIQVTATTSLILLENFSEILHVNKLLHIHKVELYLFNFFYFLHL